MDPSATIPVREAHAMDAARLARWLGERLPSAGALTIRQFRGGQSNPTYLLSTDGGRYVLRRKPPGALLPSAHAVDREFRILNALAGTSVPVPRALSYCDDASVAGTPFYLMEYVEGRIFWNPALPGLTPPERAAIYEEMNRVIAAIHAIDPDAAGLADFGRRENYVARQIERWSRQYRASELERIDSMEQLIDWLPRHVPPDEPARITHGDFRIDNLIFDHHEFRIRAVIDWELATLGNALSDFAYHCMPYRMPEAVRKGLAGLDLAPLGIPSEHDYVDRYLRRTGRPAASTSAFDFYIAFNLFRLASILQGVAARARLGNASSEHATEAGSLTRPIADLGWAQARKVH
ncbi:MAG TPA: phosphotransferase [Steroidobacteraceae bacterium]|nr:phosphotransferase [Steroidobacteraceae bacterium]